jgi:hypothetical protein
MGECLAKGMGVDDSRISLFGQIVCAVEGFGAGVLRLACAISNF